MGTKKGAYGILAFQIIMLIIFAVFGRYAREADAKALKPKSSLNNYYPMFQDVHVMIFIGFGFLMTFLHKYAFSAVGFNFLLSAVLVQWGLICEGIFSSDFLKIGIPSILGADILTAAVLISMGAVLGKTTPLQLVLMGVIEGVLFAGNEKLLDHFKVVDVGGSIVVHAFGAYFGLAVSRVLNNAKHSDHEGSTYTSDRFAMIGTLFLWVFWPSFNAATVTGDDQQRAVLNTYLSIAASCVAAFATSAIVTKENKFDMVHVQNATLAGGVGVGAVANFMLQPYGAIFIGIASGVLSTVGYAYIQPWLLKKTGIHDSCGVNNLHGMPAILAGLVNVFASLLASTDNYGSKLYFVFPARAPESFTREFTELQINYIELLPGLNRTAEMQALYQLIGILTTLVISIVGGTVTGFILKHTSTLMGGVHEDLLYRDELHWEIPQKGGNKKTETTVESIGMANSLPNLS